MHKLLLATGGLLLALLVLDSSNELLAQREGGAYWGAFSRGAQAAPPCFPLAARPHAAEADPAGGPIAPGLVSDLSRPGAEKHMTLLTSSANYTRISLIRNLTGGTKEPIMLAETFGSWRLLK
jgi:hypothetical protein